MTAHHKRGGENSSEKRIDIAKQLGLPPSTLNTITVKKKIRDHACVCGPGACDVWCGCVWKKHVVSWEVEVAWRRCKVVVVVVVVHTAVLSILVS
jgi:hypothetical protein